MSFESTVSLLATLARALEARLGLRPPVIDTAVAAARWASLDEEERLRWAYPFLQYQFSCEENPPRVQPVPEIVYGYFGGPQGLERYAENYIKDRAAFYGDASGMSYGDVSRESAEFTRHLVTYLRQLYSVIEPWKPTKAGGLCKLGFYAVRRLERYLAGDPHMPLPTLLDWLGSVVTGKSNWFTQMREAVYVLPWLKRWIAEYVASYYCDTLRGSIGTFADMLFSVMRDVMGFLDWLKVAIVTAYSQAPAEPMRMNCAFLGVGRAAHRALEVAAGCLADTVIRVCRGVARTYPWYRWLERHCHSIMETLLTDPPTFLDFYTAYYGARNPRQLRDAYMILVRRAGVPYYAVRLTFAYLRATGQWGYPSYLA